MKRIDFLIQLTGLAGLTWLIPGAPKKAETYTLYEGRIAGYAYYDGKSIEKHLHPGRPLQLRREPDNPHDRRAIEIFTGRHKLGYISRVDNPTLAAMLDNGEKLTAEVAGIRRDGQVWERVKVRIRFVRTLQGF